MMGGIKPLTDNLARISGPGMGWRVQEAEFPEGRVMGVVSAENRVVKGCRWAKTAQVPIAEDTLFPFKHKETESQRS